MTTGNYPTGYDTTNVFGRVDHQATPSAHLQLRYSLYDVGSQNARNVGALNDVSRGAALDDTDQTVAPTFCPRCRPAPINEARVQYTRSDLAAPVNDIVGPAVNISGVASWGTATFSPTARVLDVVQAVDTLTLQRGDHLVKAGGDLLYNRVDDRISWRAPGRLHVHLAGELPARRLLDVSAGVRRAVAVPVEPEPRAVRAGRMARPTRSDGQRRHPLRPAVAAASRSQLDANNVSPRLGVAYAPGEGKTVVRASGGLYFDRIPLRATSNALQRDGSKYQVAQLSFGQPGAPVWPSVAARRFRRTCSLQSRRSIPTSRMDGPSRPAIEIERAIGHRMSASVGYSYLRGRRDHHVPQRQRADADRGAKPTRWACRISAGRIPTSATSASTDSIGDSWSNGLTLSLLTRSAPWGRARVSYTFSKSLDDAGNAFFQTPQDNANVLGDKGPSDNDQRHRVVLSGTFGDGTSTAIRRALLGMQIGYVFAYASALPFNPQAGVDLNNDTTINDRPLGMGRNSDRMPCWAESDRSADVRNDDARPPVVADAALRLPAAGRADGRRVQHLQPHERRQHQQQLWPWDVPVGDV